MKQTWFVSAVANWSRLSAIKKMLRICARNWAANFWATNKHCYDTDLNITKSTDRAFTLTALKWSGYSKGIQPVIMSLRKYGRKGFARKKATGWKKSRKRMKETTQEPVRYWWTQSQQSRWSLVLRNNDPLRLRHTSSVQLSTPTLGYQTSRLPGWSSAVDWSRCPVPRWTAGFHTPPAVNRQRRQLTLIFSLYVNNNININQTFHHAQLRGYLSERRALWPNQKQSRTAQVFKTQHSHQSPLQHAHRRDQLKMV